MRSGELVVLGTYPDLASAEMARALLETGGVRAVVGPTDPIGGPIAAVSTGVKLLVDAVDRVRACAILEDTSVSEAELESLATGVQPREDA